MNQPLAYIHPQAKIAPNVVIEPFVTINANVTIDEGTWVGPNAVIMDGAKIGKNCKIYPGAVISAPPQDLKYKGEASTVEVGDNTVIREYVTINRGTALDKNTTEVGKNCLIMAYVHLAHDCIVGDNVILANSVQLAGHIEVQDYAFIGGTSAVHQFVKIGQHAFVSGGSLVRKDIPPFTKAARDPISFSGINSVGLRRRGYTHDKINEIQEIYRLIFLSGLNNNDALDKIELEMSPSKERDEIVNFIRNSDRGIMRGSGG